MLRKGANDFNLNDNKENQESFDTREQHRYMQTTKSANFKRI